MLTVLVDAREPWFSYIWEEFARIAGLETPWRIVARHESEVLDASQSPILEYGRSQQVPGSLFIPALPVFTTDDYHWLDGSLPIFRETLAGDGNYDLFYNAFVNLSRLEEWHAAASGKQINSYAGRHPRRTRRTWLVPVVNLLFRRLDAKMRQMWPQVVFADGKPPLFEFSHDIDYLSKTLQLRLKQSAFKCWNALHSLLRGDISTSLSGFAGAAVFALVPSDYWCFDYWEELERRFETRSVYYVYAAPKGNPCNLLIDPSYRLADEPKLTAKLRELLDSGFEVGLHGSYPSALDAACLELEKQNLEKHLGCKVEKVRQHWLRYDENTTPYAHERLGLDDSTLGWNDLPGFRSGCASRYRPYDHLKQRPMEIFETPMVVMDSQFFDYASGREAEVKQQVMALLDSLLGLDSVHVSINWHQRTCHTDYGWQRVYEEILGRVA